MSTPFESDRPAGSEQSQAPNGKLNEQFRELFDGVEDLIKRVSEVNSPEIQKIRAKARVALMRRRAPSRIRQRMSAIVRATRPARRGITCAAPPARRMITSANIPGTRSARERWWVSRSAYSYPGPATEKAFAHTVWDASYRRYRELNDTEVWPRRLQFSPCSTRESR